MFESFRRKTPMAEFLDKVEGQPETPSEEDVEKSEYKSRLQRKQEVLDYIITHQGEVIRETHISESIGITPSYVNILVRELLSKKTVTRKGKRGSHKFKVNRQSVTPGRKPKTKVMEKPLQIADAKKVEHELNEKAAALSSMEDLVFEYVRETRCTDVLHFLSWLEQRELNKVEE